jgi:hypothetical protein
MTTTLYIDIEVARLSCTPINSIRLPFRRTSFLSTRIAALFCHHVSDRTSDQVNMPTMQSSKSTICFALAHDIHRPCLSNAYRSVECPAIERSITQTSTAEFLLVDGRRQAPSRREQRRRR